MTQDTSLEIVNGQPEQSNQETSVIAEGSSALMRLITRAVESSDFDVAKLSALLEVKERWDANEARKAFVTALNAFKADAPKIIKDKAVNYGNTKYKHALAGAASEIIGAALAAHDISHRWDVQQEAAGKITVTCILTHALGHSERVSLSASPDTSGSKNSIQAIGSTVSYLQRYSLFSATGLVPKDADDDGAGGTPKTMPESVKLDWLAKVDEVTDKEQWQELWSQITAATTAAGDVAAHEELRAKMAAKHKGLK